MDRRTASLVIKAGKDNGFEVVHEHNGAVELCSARHPLTAIVSFIDEQYHLKLTADNQPILWAVRNHFSHSGLYNYTFSELNELGLFLRQAANLAQSSPEQLAYEYQQEVKEILAEPDSSPELTEAIREVKQRIGQDKYRKALMDYWDGKCAVTGVAIPEALRASHAKPWAECSSDEERLDKYNGFLLTANLDALFDKFLISFDREGKIMVPDKFNRTELAQLGISSEMKLRKLDVYHEKYLDWHRKKYQSI